MTCLPPHLARLTAFLLLAVMAVAAGVFGISSTWAQGNTMQAPDRPTLTIPPITAQGYRWNNYAAYRIHVGSSPGIIDRITPGVPGVTQQQLDNINNMRIKGGVMHVHYQIACSTTNINNASCPAPIRRYTTISCDGTEGGLIHVNLSQGGYSNPDLRPYKLTLTINEVVFDDWHGRVSLPSYCEEGQYVPPRMTVTNQPNPPAAVTVN